MNKDQNFFLLFSLEIGIEYISHFQIKRNWCFFHCNEIDTLNQKSLFIRASLAILPYFFILNGKVHFVYIYRFVNSQCTGCVYVSHFISLNMFNKI